MLFCTYSFYLFLALVLLTLKLTQRYPRIQGLVVLGASNFFYGYWDWRFLSLIWISTIIDYTAARIIGSSDKQRQKRTFLLCSIIANLGILFTFKYFDFFQLQAETLFDMIGIYYSPYLLSVVLPVGISFYTFQTMSYTIDVYRGEMKPCTNFITFAQYVCFFPQLVAGPIERASHLIPQLEKPRIISLQNLLSGGLLIIWGTFKKAVIADTAGLYIVDRVFANPTNGPHLWLATIAFGIQIYCDFSGYCDIARGTARCMDIKLVENFNAPYFARNISEFWRRWHVSLSQWFRDYLYISLGGNRKGKGRTLFNLFITMLLCGLWHGAKLTFLIWGIYHGLLLLAHRSFRIKKNENQQTTMYYRLISGIKIIFTMLAVCYGWMIFRIDSATDIPRYSRLLIDPFLHGWNSSSPNTIYMLGTVSLLLLLTITANCVQHRAKTHYEEIETLKNLPMEFIGALAGIILAIIMVFGTLGIKMPFIYFQF